MSSFAIYIVGAIILIVVLVAPDGVAGGVDRLLRATGLRREDAA